VSWSLKRSVSEALDFKNFDKAQRRTPMPHHRKIYSKNFFILRKLSCLIELIKYLSINANDRSVIYVQVKYIQKNINYIYNA
jgi:hypothetical protein